MFKHLALLLASLLLISCGSYQSGSGSVDQLGSEDQVSTDPVPEPDKGGLDIPPDYTYSAVSEDLAVFGMGEKKEVLHFDIQKGIVKVNVPFPVLSILEVSGHVPNHPEIEFYTNLNSSSLTIEIPLSKYIELTQSPNTLPDGRPLPGVTGGEAPRLGFPIPNTKLDAYAYIGNDYIAFFVESDLKLPIKMVGNIKNVKGDSIIGLLGWLPAEQGYRGGVFTSLKFPRELVALIANSQ